jgi:putative transposase
VTLRQSLPGASLNHVTFYFRRQGKPTDNAYIESFNGKLRVECLNENWFVSLADAQEKLEAWKMD